MYLANPLWLLTALFVVPIIYLYIRARKAKVPSLTFSAVKLAKSASLQRRDWKRYLRHANIVLITITILSLAMVLSRPQSMEKGQDIHSEGIDIVIALDISASMMARDFTPDRVGAAKRVASDFISGRPHDRIGMVLFGKYAFAQCPLTVDHAILMELIDSVKIGLTNPDATAIGQALGSALNRLKSSESKSKTIILLTDGENNSGLPPLTAAEAAEALGVRVYTIGVGKHGTAPYPANDIFGRPTVQQVPVSIDEELLTKIAKMTDGLYFRATNNRKLEQIFDEIDQMEKTRIRVTSYTRYSELFYNWAYIAAGALLLSLLLSTLVVRRMI